MKVLLVEDEIERREWFRQKCLDIDMTDSVDEAIRWLGENEYDILFLDHDLRDNDRPGWLVAKHLIANPTLQPKMKTIVHSMNSVSAKKIYERLLEAGREVWQIPYSVLYRLGLPTFVERKVM